MSHPWNVCANLRKGRVHTGELLFWIHRRGRRAVRRAQESQSDPSGMPHYCRTPSQAHGLFIVIAHKIIFRNVSFEWPLGLKPWCSQYKSQV